MRAGLHIEADPRGPVADCPVGWRFNHSVTEIEAGLVENRAIVQQCRLRLSALRAQHVDLFLGSRENSLIVLQSGGLIAQIGGSLLSALNGPGASLRQSRDNCYYSRRFAGCLSTIIIGIDESMGVVLLPCARSIGGCEVVLACSDELLTV